MKISIAIFYFLFLIYPHNVDCAKKNTASSASPVEHEPTIEEVTAKQLERILADKDYVAVYWCKLVIYMAYCTNAGINHCGLNINKSF
jgi:hypothetical protein